MGLARDIALWNLLYGNKNNSNNNNNGVEGKPVDGSGVSLGGGNSGNGNNGSGEAGLLTKKQDRKEALGNSEMGLDVEGKKVKKLQNSEPNAYISEQQGQVVLG